MKIKEIRLKNKTRAAKQEAVQLLELSSTDYPDFCKRGCFVEGLFQHGGQQWRRRLPGEGTAYPASDSLRATRKAEHSNDRKHTLTLYG